MGTHDVGMLHPWGELHALGVFEWNKVVRRCNLPTATKAVGFLMAQYATPKTGADIKVGQARIARESGMSKRNVQRHTAALEKSGLLFCLSRGTNVGLKDATSEYRLTALAALVEQIGATPDDQIIDVMPEGVATSASSGSDETGRRGWRQIRQDLTTDSTGGGDAGVALPLQYLSNTSPDQSPPSGDLTSAPAREIEDEEAERNRQLEALRALMQEEAR